MKKNLISTFIMHFNINLSTQYLKNKLRPFSTKFSKLDRIDRFTQLNREPTPSVIRFIQKTSLFIDLVKTSEPIELIKTR